MTNKISRIFDYIFARALATLIIFIWMKYYIDDLTLSIIYTSVIMVCLIIIFDVVFSKKLKRNSLETDKKHKEPIMNQLCLNSNSVNLDFFNKMLSTRHAVRVEKTCLIIEKGNEKLPVYLKFTTTKLAPNNIVDIIKDGKDFGAKKILILCNGANTLAYSFAASIEGMDIIIYDDKKVYELMKKYDIFPEINIKITKYAKKYKLKEMAAIALSKKRVKGYFLSSLLLLFSSFFVAYAIYYRIAATILMIMALVALKDFDFIREKENLL